VKTGVVQVVSKDELVMADRRRVGHVKLPRPRSTAAILHAKHNHPSPLAAMCLHSLVFGWERGRLRAMCSIKSHRSIMQARSRWPWRGRDGGLALCYPSLTRVRSNISKKTLRAGSLQLTREKYELLAEVPEWSHRGRFQGRALKFRHRRCLRAFATVGSCAIFAFPVSRPTSVAPLTTTFHHSVGP
jgi:hypothetical protein